MLNIIIILINSNWHLFLKLISIYALKIEKYRHPSLNSLKYTNNSNNEYD